MVRKHRDKTFTIKPYLPTTLLIFNGINEIEKSEIIHTMVYDVLDDTLTCYTDNKKIDTYCIYDKKSDNHKLFIGASEITVNDYIVILKSLLEV